MYAYTGNSDCYELPLLTRLPATIITLVQVLRPGSRNQNSETQLLSLAQSLNTT